MALSFTYRRTPFPPLTPGARRRVLVTGAAGRIGSSFVTQARERYELRLLVRGDEQRIEQVRPMGELVEGDITDLRRMKQACAGIDTVLHLAANPDAGAAWSQLLGPNIIGAYNVMVAARSAGCRRVVYASSIHAVSGYPADVQVKTTDPVNPGDIYGVTKCFGEALGRYMAEQEGLSVICLRIGGFHDLETARKDESLGLLDAYVSDRDLQQLMEKSIDDERLQFAISNGLSDNQFKRLDLTDARELLGYAPQDDLAREHPALKSLGLREAMSTHSQRDQGQASGIREDVG